MASSLSVGFFRLLLRFLRFLLGTYSPVASEAISPLSTPTVLVRSVRLVLDESRGSCSRTLSVLAAFDVDAVGFALVILFSSFD